MIISWPGKKRLRDIISRLKKARKEQGTVDVVELRLVVFEDGEWHLSMSSNQKAHPPIKDRESLKSFIGTEDVDLSRQSNSEREAVALLMAVKEAYVLSHADGAEDDDETPKDVLDTSEEDAESDDLPEESTAKLAPEYVQGFNDAAFQNRALDTLKSATDSGMSHEEKRANRMAAKTLSFTDPVSLHSNLSNHPQDLDDSERETPD